MQKCSQVDLQKINYLQVKNKLSMHQSDALGLPLVKKEAFGADMLEFQPYQSTEIHTHSGDHILFVVIGEGWIVFDGEYQNLKQNDCYLVPGSIPHGIGTQCHSMLLLSVANDHQPVDSVERSLSV